MSITGPTGVEIRLVGLLHFDGDVLAHIDSGFHLPDRSLLEVVGATGSIRVHDPWHCVEPSLEILRQGRPTVIETFPAISSYQLELEEFAYAIRGEPTRLLGRDDALGQAVTIAGLYQAAQERRTVSLA